MILEPDVRKSLRTATDSYHRRVDALFSTADLGEVGSYGRFLQAQAAAHVPAECALARGGIAAIMPDWENRRRSDLLRADLAALGLDVPEPAGPLELAGEGAMLGALYVLEGSRLGGALLRRSVPASFPAQFLGQVDSKAWQRLLGFLDERLNTESERSLAIAAACEVFTLFERGGQQHLRVT